MNANYSRESPSPRYRRLIEQYRLLHTEGEKHLGIPPEQTFDGRSLPMQAAHIKRMIKRTGARTILDYGSGKGQHYPDIRSYWGITELRCYDPGYERFSELPTGTFDGVICTDVLEHCPEEDMRWILGELFGYSSKFVFANVACFPARKRLPSGGNAHCTIKPPNWWRDQIQRAASAKPGIAYEFRLAYKEGEEIKESVIGA